MKTLVIYDNTGYIISQASGEPAPREPQGIPFMWVEIPKKQRIISIDVKADPHQPILEDIPSTEQEERIKALEESNAEMMNLIAIQGITPKV